MATHVMTGSSTHQTIATGGTAETITLDRDYGQVEVANWDTAARIYFTVNGATATVAGEGTYVAGPGTALQVSAPSSGGTVDVLSIICATAGVAYTVTGQ